MYIGEISKPSVERSEIKSKPKLPVTSPVEAVPPVTDRIDLSSKAKRRYQEFQKKHQNKKNNNTRTSQIEDTQEIDNDAQSPINLLNQNAQTKGFEPPPNIDYSYLLVAEHGSVSNSQPLTERQMNNETDEPDKTSAIQTHIDINA